MRSWDLKLSTSSCSSGNRKHYCLWLINYTFSYINGKVLLVYNNVILVNEVDKVIKSPFRFWLEPLTFYLFETSISDRSFEKDHHQYPRLLVRGCVSTDILSNFLNLTLKISIAEKQTITNKHPSLEIMTLASLFLDFNDNAYIMSIKFPKHLNRTHCSIYLHFQSIIIMC